MGKWKTHRRADGTAHGMIKVTAVEDLEAQASCFPTQYTDFEEMFGKAAQVFSPTYGPWHIVLDL